MMPKTRKTLAYQHKTCHLRPEHFHINKASIPGDQLATLTVVVGDWWRQED
jgi:hypothetical protein